MKEFDRAALAAQAALAGEDGTVLLTYLLRRFGFTHRTTHVTGDPSQSLINEGQRQVMIEIGRLLETTIHIGVDTDERDGLDPGPDHNDHGADDHGAHDPYDSGATGLGLPLV